MTGKFENGRGEFYDQELFEGRMIYVRYVWSDITPSRAFRTVVFRRRWQDLGGELDIGYLSRQTEWMSASGGDQSRLA